MSADPPFRVVARASDHDRSHFNCGAEPLNRCLREQASQDVRRRVAACFVALAADHTVADFYTLASASVALADLPPGTAKRLPRYPSVPGVRMGHLAVDSAFKGRGLGGALLADALHRCIQSEIAAFALLVDAKDASAAAFYGHHGFLGLPDTPLWLFLSLATVAKLR